MRILKDGLALLVLGGTIAGQEGDRSTPQLQIVGRVIDCDSRPIAHAAVRVVAAADRVRHELEFTSDDLLARPDGTTDEQGRFALSATGDDVLYVAAQGHLAVVVVPRGQGGALTALPELTITLPEATVHAGTVRDTAGRPIEGAVVRCTPLVGGEWTLAGLRSRVITATRSDARGRFRLHGAPRVALRVDVFAPGHYHESASPVGEGSPLNFVVEPSGYLAGRAVGRDGEPLAGGILDVVYETMGFGPEGDCVTAEDGSFRVTVAERGRLRVKALDPSGERQLVGPIVEGPAENLLVRPTLAADVDGDPARLELRLRDAETGRPVRGARVSVFGGGMPLPRSLPWLPHAEGLWGGGDFPSTDADGRVLLDLSAKAIRANHVQLRIRAEGHASTIKEFELDAIRPPLILDLPLEGIARGRVVDPTGAPIVGAEVFWLLRSIGTLWQIGETQVHAVRTDATGHYELRGLPRTQVTLMAIDREHRCSDPVDVRTDLDDREVACDFTLEPPRRITLRLPGDVSPLGLSASWSNPMEGMPTFGGTSIHFIPADVRQSSFANDRRASFDVRRSGPLQFTVHRMADASSPYELRFLLPEFVGDEAGDIAVPRAVLATGRIAGKVVTDGIPFTRFAVEAVLLVPADPHVHPFSGGFQCPVDATGSFELEIHPGTYGLVLIDLATGIPVHEHGSEIEVVAGRSVELRLTPSLARVDLRLASADGAVEPPTVGRLEISRVESRFAEELSYSFRHIDWRPDQPIELLLPAGRIEIAVRSGARTLGLARSFGFEGTFEAELEVTDARRQELVLNLPSRLPTEAIDR